MIGYTLVGANDLDKAKGFYDDLFGAIGVKRLLVALEVDVDFRMRAIEPTSDVHLEQFRGHVIAYLPGLPGLLAQGRIVKQHDDVVSAQLDVEFDVDDAEIEAHVRDLLSRRAASA